MLYPEGTKVLIKPDSVEKMTEGGILVPDSVQTQQQFASTSGKIVALGPLAEVFFSASEDGIEKHAAKPGDRCRHVAYAGAIVKIEGKDYRIIQDSDILGYDDSDEAVPSQTRISMLQ